MKEVFKPVKGYEGLYEVSNLGRVKSLERTVIRKNGRKLIIKERVLKAGVSSTGYYIVILYNKGKKTKKVHQLVAIAFLGHEPNGLKGLIVDHKTNDKLDNRLDNLQLITARENSSKDKRGGSSNYTGVCWHKNINKWIASIYIDGKLKHLGHFTCELEAHEAYQAKLKEIQCS